MTISDEAVETAARKLFQSTMDEPWEAASREQEEQCRTIAKEALEAAAPFIRAQALEDAAAEIVVTVAPSIFITEKPDAIMSVIGREQTNWLRARAAAERGGE